MNRKKKALLIFALLLLTLPACGQPEDLGEGSSAASEQGWVGSLPEVSSQGTVSSITAGAGAEEVDGTYTVEDIFSFDDFSIENMDVGALNVSENGQIDLFLRPIDDEGNLLKTGEYRWYHSDDGVTFAERELYWEEELREKCKPYSYSYMGLCVSDDGSVYLNVLLEENQEAKDMKMYRASQKEGLQEQPVERREGLRDGIYWITETGKAVLFDQDNERGGSRCYDTKSHQVVSQFQADFGGNAVYRDRVAVLSNGFTKTTISVYDLNTGDLIRKQEFKDDREVKGNTRIGLGEHDLYLLEEGLGLFHMDLDSEAWSQLTSDGEALFQDVERPNMPSFLRVGPEGELYYVIDGEGIKKLTFTPSGS